MAERSQSLGGLDLVKGFLRFLCVVHDLGQYVYFAFFVLLVYFLLFVLCCQFSTSASDCLERLVSEMTYYVSSLA